MLVCKRVIYSGRVQGVGFRYTAQRLAGGLAVAGYVKNLPNGNVELVAEGEPDQVEALLERIDRRLAGNIMESKVTPEAPQGFTGFKIQH